MQDSTSTHPPVQRLWLVMALSVWALLSLGHGTGLDIVSVMVEWARLPGSLSEEGGQTGFMIGERVLAGILGGLFLAALITILRRASRFGALALIGLIPAWALCGALAWLAWKIIIVYTTELVHFAQYALIGALLSVAIGRGRRPQLAFVIACVLGLIDEAWQHYGLHAWLLEERTHYLDFSDPFLNGIGAFAGVLPAASWLRLREEGASQIRIVHVAALAASVILLPLLLVDPVTLSSWFGSYPYYPFWDEHTNLKAVHWVTPQEGIPLMPAFLLVVGSVLDPVRRGLTVTTLAISAVLIGVAIQPFSRIEGTPVHEQVPVASVHRIEDAAIRIDGMGGEPAWQQANVLGPFVDNVTGLDRAADCAHEQPLAATHARVLWSTEALYILLDVQDPDVWARDLPRDSTTLLADEGIRLFVDDGGDEVLFYEFSLSPANTMVDVLQLVPAAPLDFNPWSPTMSWIRFDAPEVSHAIHVDGTLEWVDSALEPVTSTVDVGYQAEIRIPWQVLSAGSSPSGNSARAALPPRPDQQWRLGLYRMETPRPVGPLPAYYTPAEAQAQLGLTPAAWEDLVHERSWQLDEEHGAPGSQIWAEHARRCGGLQAWSPTFHDLRQPARFGVIQFSDR